MNDFQKKVRAIVEKNFANGTPANIRKEIEELRRAMKLPTAAKQVANQVLNQVQSEYENLFVKQRTQVSTFISDSLLDNADTFQAKTLEAVRRGLERGETEEQILKRVARSAQAADRHYKTILRTAQAAIAQSSANETAKQVQDDPWMKYAGVNAGSSRKFCKAHVGEVRRLSEWQELKNDFGQSVAEWLGGYNCIHRLVFIPNYKP